MSSFHKPKLYRTLDGCCICKAKSSSSRFTSSAKYEDYFGKCFHLSEPRRGEICNACVLLVKRFKKLPVSSVRHWGHVVDARAGPGVKNFVRERRRESCRERSFKKKHVYKRKPNPDTDTESDTIMSSPPPRKIVRLSQDSEVGHKSTSETEPIVSDFIDLNIWKRKKICCGTIFVGPFGEAIVDPRFLVRCSLHQTKSEKQTQQPPVTLPKIENPLFTIEKIIESELKTFSQISPSQSSSITEEEDRAKMAGGSPVSLIGQNGPPTSPTIGRNKVSRSPVGQSDTDADEGFYDKPSISPTNSID